MKCIRNANCTKTSAKQKDCLCLLVGGLQSHLWLLLLSFSCTSVHMHESLCVPDKLGSATLFALAH